MTYAAITGDENMTRVTPELFVEAFAKVADRHRLSEKTAVYWSKEQKGQRAPGDTAEFTRLIEREVVPDLAGELKLKWKLQHRVVCDNGQRGRLDAVFYESDPSVPLIAWEHEGHISSRWRNEIRNLRSVSTPLKVLVTYLKRGARIGAEEWVRRYQEAYASTPKTPSGELLVIFSMPNGDWKYF